MKSALDRRALISKTIGLIDKQENTPSFIQSRDTIIRIEYRLGIVLAPFGGPEYANVPTPVLYVRKLGFFCQKELQLDKITPVNFRFRLGSLDYVNWMEQKPNAIKPRY